MIHVLEDLPGRFDEVTAILSILAHGTQTLKEEFASRQRKTSSRYMRFDTLKTIYTQNLAKDSSATMARNRDATLYSDALADESLARFCVYIVFNVSNLMYFSLLLAISV